MNKFQRYQARVYVRVMESTREFPNLVYSEDGKDRVIGCLCLFITTIPVKFYNLRWKGQHAFELLDSQKWWTAEALWMWRMVSEFYLYKN